jgi:hypothetical protein
MSKFPPLNTIPLYHSSLGALEQLGEVNLTPQVGSWGRHHSQVSIPIPACSDYPQENKSGRFCRMTLVCRRKREIDIYSEGSLARAETVIGGHRTYLSRIYLNARNSWHLRMVNYVELSGVDKATGSSCYKRALPD